MATLNEKEFRNLSLQEQRRFVELGNNVVDEPGIGAQAADIGLRALDFAGGLARTGAAGLASIPQAALGLPTAARVGDVTAALQGRAPGSAEFLERSGVPAGPSADILPEETTIPFTDINIGAGDTSVRDVGGFGLDVLTDPLSLIGRASKVAGKIVKPAQTTLKKTGEKVFEGSLKSIDEQVRAASKGAEPFSKLARQEGLKGNSSRLLEQSQQLNNRLLEQRSRLFSEADEFDVAIDTKKALGPAREEIARLKKSQLPKNRQKATKMEEILDDIQGKPTQRVDPRTLKVETVRNKLSLEDATNAKTEFAEGLPDSSFTPFGKLKGPEKKVQEKLRQGFKEEVVAAGNRNVGIIGDEIDIVNKKIQTLIAAQKPLQRAVKSEAKLNITRPVDSLTNLLLGVGARTRGGRLLEQAGDIPGLDTVLRQGAVQGIRPEDRQGSFGRLGN